MSQTRICSECKQEKNLIEDFYPQTSNRSHQSGGYLKKCKECTLNYNKKIASKPKFKENVWANKIQYRYGITVDDYNSLLKKQNYSCGICKTKDPSSKRKGLKKFHHTITSNIARPHSSL